MLLNQFGITTVYVTHDQLEALILADRIALMNEGRIEQVGTAREIYEAPRNLFAADFLNFEPETPALNTVDGALLSPALAPFTVGFRPECARVGGHAAGAPAESLTLRGEILDVRDTPLRSACVLCVRAAGADLWLQIDRGEGRGEGLAVGELVRVAIPRFHLFDKVNGLRVDTRGAAPET